MINWYKTALWRNLVDMHIPDWNDTFMTRFDPEEYSNLMERAGIQASEVYAGNCLGICFWPTKAGHMHQGLKGIDIVGPVVDNNRAKGIYPIIYYNIWSRWAHDNFPDWRMVSVDGRSTIDNGDGTFVRYGVCCMNAPGFREYTKQQLIDLCESFDMDGFWIDMIGWNGTICHCAHCRRRYFEETDREIPRYINWYDPDWVLFQRKREEWYADFADLVRTTILKIKPNVSVTQQCGSWLGGWIGGVNTKFLSASDYLAGDFYDDSLGYSVICKFLNNTTQNKPFEFMTSRCVSLADHTTIKSIHELKISACAAIAHHAAITFIDAIDPDGTMNPILYDKLGSLREDLDDYLKEVSINAKIIRDVSVYFNFESLIDLSVNGKLLKEIESSRGVFAGGVVDLLPTMKNIGKSLISAHIPYDMVSTKSLSNAIIDSRVIILPSIYMLEKQEIDLLTKYVINGGNLIVTERSSIMDKNGNKNDDFLLCELTGVHYNDMTYEDVTYFSPTDIGKDLFPEYNDKYPMTVDRQSVIIKADDDVDILACLTLPYSHSGEIHKFGSAISNPPGIKTGYPAVTLKRFGKGRVMYIAAAIEKEINDAQQRVFIDLIKFMMGKPPSVEMISPKWLEAILFDDNEKNRYILYLLASVPMKIDLTAYNIEIRINTDRIVKSVSDIKSCADIQFEIIKDKVIFKVAKVDPFSMIVINYA